MTSQRTIQRTILAADLFCGSGGTSTGLMQAAEELGLKVDLIAVNHWQTAIETHTANHPGVTHFCEDLETVNPRHAVPGGRLDLLVASPECVHHSNARGGRPMSDQSRSSAWHILRWADALHIETILIENVKEFREWGPLNEAGRPIPAMKGRLYRQFLSSLRALGYQVSERIVNAADFGDATTRQRLFIQARRGKRPQWPTPTHLKPAAKTAIPGLLDGLPTWRPAREIIDWTLPGQSIYERKRPLAPATMARIYAGLRKYSGLPFITSSSIVPQFASQGPRDIERPIRTLTTQSRGVGLCEPFIVRFYSERADQERYTASIHDPLHTVTTAGAGAVVQPFIIPNFGEAPGQEPRSHSVEAPLPTVTGHGAGCLVEPSVTPFLIGAGGPTGAGEPQSVSDPLGTVLTKNSRALVQPYLVVLRRHCDAQSVELPAPTVTAGGSHLGVAEPFLVVNRTHSDARPLSDPVPTLTTGDNMILAQPFIVATGHKGGNGSYVYSAERPLPTVTSQDEIAVCEPFLTAMEHSTEGHDRRCYDTERPLPTITGKAMFGVVEPFLNPFLSKFHGSHAGKNDGDRRNLSVDDPLPTLDTSNRVGLAEPFLVTYYGQGDAVSVDEPLDTITARDRFALVDPRLVTDGLVDKGDVVGYLDIRFRMLQPHELAAAMSFPATYHFAGNREARVKQIGNSVAVGVAKALCKTILGGLK